MQHPPLLDLHRAARDGGRPRLAAGGHGPAGEGRVSRRGYGQGAAHVPCPRLREAITGDIPAFEKSAADEAVEVRAVADMLAPLPHPVRGELEALFAEMDALESPEARVYKALDKLEAVIQHNEAPLDTWTPLEYELNRTYGAAEAAPFPFLDGVRACMRTDTEEKIKRAQ